MKRYNTLLFSAENLESFLAKEEEER